MVDPAGAMKVGPSGVRQEEARDHARGVNLRPFTCDGATTRSLTRALVAISPSCRGLVWAKVPTPVRRRCSMNDSGKAHSWNIGAQTVLNAEPDGYTLLLGDTRSKMPMSAVASPSSGSCRATSLRTRSSQRRAGKRPNGARPSGGATSAWSNAFGQRSTRRDVRQGTSLPNRPPGLFRPAEGFVAGRPRGAAYATTFSAARRCSSCR